MVDQGQGCGAAAGVAVVARSKSPKSKKGHISGWNLYMGEHSKKGADKKPLKEISNMWHALSDEERAIWNAKAKGEVNPEGLVAPANTPDAEMEEVEEEAPVADVAPEAADVAPRRPPRRHRRSLRSPRRRARGRARPPSKEDRSREKIKNNIKPQNKKKHKPPNCI